MTVPAEKTRRTEVQATSTGQTAFTYDFDLQDADELAVVHIPAATSVPVTFTRSATSPPTTGKFYVDPGFPTTKTIELLGTDITINDNVVIMGDTNLTREADYDTAGDILAATLNTEMDKRTDILQELATRQSRSLSLNTGDTSGFNMVLPVPLVANQLLQINASGTGFVSTPVSAIGFIVPSTTIDNSLPRWSGIAAGELEGSNAILDDSDNLSGINNITISSDATIAGNIAVTGTVDGVDVAAEETRLANTSGTNTGDESSATSSSEGIVELATSAEVTTGTDTSKAMTPESLAQSSPTVQALTSVGDVELGGDLTQNVTTGHLRLTIDTDSGDDDRAELYMRSGSQTAFLDLQESANRFRVSTNTAGAVLSLGAGTNDENLVLSGEEDAELATFTGDVEVGGYLTVDGTATIQLTGVEAGPDVNSDDLMVGPATGNRGITIYSADNGVGTLGFGDTTSSNIGFIRYNHSANEMTFKVNGLTGLTIDSGQHAAFEKDVEVGGDLTLGADGVNTTWESPLLTPSNVVGGQGLIAGNNNPPFLIEKHVYATNRREIMRATCKGGVISRLLYILSLPNYYDGRAVNFDLYFTQSSTNTGNVNMGLQSSSNEDGDDLTDTNLGNAAVNYAVSGVVDELQTWSSSFTPYGAADSSSQLIMGNFYRNGGTGVDTYADDIYIIGVKFYL